MYDRGERCVVLVDEAHAMPLDTLEELRLLYNLQVGKHKLIQIVLFGQPELDEKLDQSNMRQLKDRIVHHFNILPLSRKVINDYLMFRLRAAGYKGADVFSHAAVLLIGKASEGLMRRVNILADKALLAAFVENARRIEERHVRAAIRDSEMMPMRNLFNRKIIAMVGGGILFAATLAGAGWFLGQANSGRLNKMEVQRSAPAPVVSANTITPQAPEISSSVLATSNVAASSAVTETSNVTLLPLDKTLTLPAEQHSPKQHAIAGINESLLQQRLDATRSMLTHLAKGNVSIQLFYTDDVRPERMERFLGRAQRLGKLAEIYIVPIKLSGKDGYRVIYGVYADNDAGRAGINALPQRYKDAFAPTLYVLDNTQNTP
jgi:hypothetical protein